MTISISETIFKAIVDENFFDTFQPMTSEYDIRIRRTPEMIDSKKDAITFTADNLVRIEQPWLVYKEEDKLYILNGVTRYLALKELYESDDNDYIFASVPYMILEDGWTQEEAKSLQLSANNFGTETEELVIAKEAVYLYENQYEIHFESLKSSTETDDKGKALKGQKLKDAASVRATEDVLNSSLFRGKTKRHFSRYKNVIQKGTDKLQTFIGDSILTLRNGDELIVAYNKYNKLCRKNEVEPKSLDYVLDILHMDAKSKIEALNQKELEKYNSLTEEQKEEETLELKPVVIQKGDIDTWIKEQSGKLKTNNSDDSTDSTKESKTESDNGVIDVSKVNEEFEQVLNFGLTFDIKSDETNRNSLRELTDVLSAQLELTSTALDTLPTKDIEPLFQDIFNATVNLISAMPKINENTSKLSQLSNKLKKCKSKIDAFYASTQVKESNPMSEVSSEVASDSATDELTEEIDGFEVSAK